jgi:hydrogenase maturation protease
LKYGSLTKLIEGLLVNILVIGLGNPILGDDGVGWRVAEAVSSHSDLPIDVEFDFLAVGGITLMERLVGYERVILIDAIVTNQYPIGTVVCFDLQDLPYSDIGHMGSAHDTTLPNALQMGTQLGAKLPNEITVIAVESQNVFDFSEELTPPVEAAVSKAVQMVLDLIIHPASLIRELGDTHQSKEAIS